MAIPLGILTVILAAAAPVNNGPPEPNLRIVWDLHISPATEHVTRWLAEKGWCWAIEVPPHADPELVLPLRDQGFAVIGQIHAHPETRRWHWSRHNMETPDIGAFVDLIRAANAETPRVQFFMEDDSAGVGFSANYLQHPPDTHAAAKAMFDDYLKTAMAEAKRFPDVKIWAMAGFAGTAHHYARHGAQRIIVERANDDIEDLQTAIAFARGAAHQFGCAWGIDLSLWWGVIYGCVQDLPASLYTRHLWLSYINGAHTFRIEGGNLLVRPEGPTVVANAIDNFARVARTFNPGTPDAPVAVMLPRDHGWMTPAYWRTANESWNYARVPYRQGDRGVDGLFGAAYPGSVYAQDPFPKGAYETDDPPASPFALSCITPEFAPAPEQPWRAEPYIPFGAYTDRHEARQDFADHAIDPSPYRPMGDSRWGDALNVVTDDASVETLSAYEAVVVSGPVVMNDALRARLEQYVRQGGTLVWAAGVATPDDALLVGAPIQPELRVGRAWQWGNEPLVREAFRYCPVHLSDKDDARVRVLAQTRSGDPLVVSHSLDQGMVYTCLVPWFEAGHTPLANIALRLLDAVIVPVQPILVDGPPAAWTSARSADAVYVAIANHDDAPWQGRITVQNVPESFAQCIDIVSGDSFSYDRAGGKAAIDVDIAPYNVRVLRWTPPVETQ